MISKVKLITIDNGSNIVSALNKLSNKSNGMTNTHRNLRDFHVSCVAHVVNRAVKE